MKARVITRDDPQSRVPLPDACQTGGDLAANVYISAGHRQQRRRSCCNLPGSGFRGGSTNWFDADVIFKLDTRPDKVFGFQLRNDDFQPVRQGMLVLLQDAVLHHLQVTTDYLELATLPNNNSFVIRVALQHIVGPPPSAIQAANL